MMNQITTEGRVTMNPYVSMGTILFNLETTHPYTDKNGQPKEKTFCFEIKCFKENPFYNFINEHIKKNQTVRITGTLQSELNWRAENVAYINPETIVLLPSEELKEHLELYKMEQEGKRINLTSKDFIKNDFLKGYGKYRVAFSCPCCAKLLEYNSNELSFDISVTCKFCNNGFLVHASE